MKTQLALSSEIEWETTPTLICLEISDDLIRRAKDAVEYLKKIDAGYLCFWNAADYQLYIEQEDEGPVDLVHEGENYILYPGYIDFSSVTLKVYKSGGAQLELLCKHSNEGCYADFSLPKEN